MKIFAGMVAFLMVAGVVLAGEEEGFKSPAVMSAMRTYGSEVGRATREAERRIKKAKERYLRVLERGVKNATRAGDLNEANILLAEKKEMEKDARVEVVMREPVDPIVGKWNWPGGGTAEFRADGTMTNRHRGEGPHDSGTWKAEKGIYILKWQSGWINELTMKVIRMKNDKMTGRGRLRNNKWQSFPGTTRSEADSDIF